MFDLTPNTPLKKKEFCSFKRDPKIKNQENTKEL